MDRTQLKIAAQKQRLAELVAGYEDAVTDLRVEITFLRQQIQQLSDEVVRLQQEKQTEEDSE